VPLILGVGHAAQSGLSTLVRHCPTTQVDVDASFQKALPLHDRFWNSCAGIVSVLRVLGFSDPYERSVVRIVRLASGPTSVRGSTCPFIKLASATAVQGWRPKFDMHVRRPGKRYNCARLALIDVAQRAWTCPFIKPWSRPKSKFDDSKFAGLQLAGSSLFEIEQVCHSGTKSWYQSQVQAPTSHYFKFISKKVHLGRISIGQQRRKLFQG
jgi:hypothetical protein